MTTFDTVIAIIFAGCVFVLAKNIIRLGIELYKDRIQ